MTLKPDKPLCLVEWGDATYSSLRHYDPHKEHTPALTQTVGFLLEYDDEKALIYTDYFEDGDYRNEVLIPCAMIHHIWILEVK